ncbi:LptF/LptG family permease [uncultured Algimonas sp.]|uniref:LptF/LptG family permease n=1 Tax=uncultured Algimonas sp. TaxID=1547920 RepID=UPI00262522DC|nr:LptF/LptG family permease [uncultured Algimonas sp.]
MPDTLFRYVMARSARSLTIAFLVVTGIIMLVDFVEANRDLGADVDITPMQLLSLTLMKTPSLIEQTIPFVVLFGMMGAINGMNRRSELIVMRASGQSAWTIIRPAVWLAGLVGLVWAVVVNPLATHLYDTFEKTAAEWIGGGPVPQEGTVWLREGRGDQQIVIRADAMDMSDWTLDKATFLILDRDPDGKTRFSRRFDASTATLSPNGYWQLRDVVENAPGEPMQKLRGLSMPTGMDAAAVIEQTGGETQASFWDMPGAIRDNEAAGFSARALRLQFNRLLSLPVMLIAMTFIAAGVSMSLAREGGTLRLLIIGAALGFAVFFADSMVVAFGEVAIVPIVMATWSVPLVVLMLGITHLSRIEDG